MSEHADWQWGVFESSGRTVLGPVAMVRMQKAGIKYKKPNVFLRVRKCFQRRSHRMPQRGGMGRGRLNFGAVGTGPVD
jgi:hypothetical protein